MRPGLSGYGGGVIGKAGGFGYLGSHDINYTLAGTVTIGPTTVEEGESFRSQIDVTIGGGTQTTIVMQVVVTFSVPPSTAQSAPTFIDLSSWSNDTGWVDISGGNNTAFQCQFSKTTNGVGTIANLRFDTFPVNEAAGTCNVTIFSLSSSQVSNTRSTKTNDSILINNPSTFDGVITNPPDGHTANLDYAGGDTLAFEITVTAGVNNQTNPRVDVNITDNYGGVHISSVTTDTNLPALGTGWSNLGWTNVGGVFKNAFFANTMNVGSLVITVRVHFNTDANSPHVSCDTTVTTGQAPHSDQATGTGNLVTVNTNPI